MLWEFESPLGHKKNRKIEKSVLAVFSVYTTTIVFGVIQIIFLSAFLITGIF